MKSAIGRQRKEDRKPCDKAEQWAIPENTVKTRV